MEDDFMSYIIDKCKILKNAELELSQASTIDKNQALFAICFNLFYA